MVSAVMLPLLRVDIGEYRRRTGIDHAGYGGKEGALASPPLSSPVRCQARAERDRGQRAVADRDGVFLPDPRGELLLELPAFLAGPVVDPVGAQHAGDSRDFLLRKGRPGREGR